MTQKKDDATSGSDPRRNAESRADIGDPAPREDIPWDDSDFARISQTVTRSAPPAPTAAAETPTIDDRIMPDELPDGPEADLPEELPTVAAVADSLVSRPQPESAAPLEMEAPEVSAPEAVQHEAVGGATANISIASVAETFPEPEDKEEEQTAAGKRLDEEFPRLIKLKGLTAGKMTAPVETIMSARSDREEVPAQGSGQTQARRSDPVADDEPTFSPRREPKPSAKEEPAIFSGKIEPEILAYDEPVLSSRRETVVPPRETILPPRRKPSFGGPEAERGRIPPRFDAEPDTRQISESRPEFRSKLRPEFDAEFTSRSDQRDGDEDPWGRKTPRFGTKPHRDTLFVTETIPEPVVPPIFAPAEDWPEEERRGSSLRWAAIAAVLVVGGYGLVKAFPPASFLAAPSQQVAQLAPMAPQQPAQQVSPSAIVPSAPAAAPEKPVPAVKVAKAEPAPAVKKPAIAKPVPHKTLAQAAPPAAVHKTKPVERRIEHQDVARPGNEPDEAEIEALADQQAHPVTLAPGPRMLDASPAIPASLPTPTASGDLVYDVQAKLTRLGYSPGPVDGALSPQTRRAIMHFQNDAGMTPTGEIDSELLRRLRTARQVDLRFEEGPQPVAR